MADMGGPSVKVEQQGHLDMHVNFHLNCTYSVGVMAMSS